ncbi:hypothetical protein HQ585_17180 [candidate division KSB1 bacterium]|nr:hypothetical protein [candidate division KSB1 bacterium]
MQISIQELIARITREVIEELGRQNVTVTVDGYPTQTSLKGLDPRTRSEELDMSKYKTPILTENHIQRLHELTGEIVVPKGTIITPKARELLSERQLKITIN